MSRIFLTGGTGYLGGYVVTELLQRTDRRIAVLTRARDLNEAHGKLWRALQMHLCPAAFRQALTRLDVIFGDLHAPRLGIAEDDYRALVRDVESVIHVAASLNRKSAKACLNTNLRGTLAVIQLARDVAALQGLRRFSYVSTVAVAGHRWREVVEEDAAIDWDRSDYDPYGRTKKFCEHMVSELLPEIPRTVFRPAIVLGDSRHERTTQFDMVRAFVALADLPLVPLRPDDRVDIVNADFVGEAVARLHLAATPKYERYHLSSGRRSVTVRQVAEAMAPVLGRPMRFAPRLGASFSLAFRGLDKLPRGNLLQSVGALMKVFWPYITYDTVFANERVTDELGIAPTPFTHSCGGLYRFAKQVRFRFPYAPLPEEAA